jgi:hypothetical protein
MPDRFHFGSDWRWMTSQSPSGTAMMAAAILKSAQCRYFEPGLSAPTENMA